MMVFNSFTATNDNNFGMQMTEWQICLAIVGKFLQREVWNQSLKNYLFSFKFIYEHVS